MAKYVQRPELLDQIERQLLGGDGKNESKDEKDDGGKVLAVWGLGGAGKAQLVLCYLQRYRSQCKSTLWVEASRKTTIERDFVGIHQVLFDVPVAEMQDAIKLEHAIVRVKSFCSRRTAADEVQRRRWWLQTMECSRISLTSQTCFNGDCATHG